MSDQDPEKRARKRQKLANRERAREVEDLKDVLDTEQGRRVFWRILEKTHPFESSFTGDNRINFLEGERNIGLWLLNEIMEADTVAYIEMLNDERIAQMKESENEELEKEESDE